MRPASNPDLPPVSPSGCVAQLACLTAPVIGAFVGRAINPEQGLWWGIIIGIWVMGIGMHLVHRKQAGKTNRCAGCGRAISLVARPAWMGGGGVIMRTQDLSDPRQGIGVSCDKCRKTYCSNCRPYGTCACGGSFRQIHLRYR